VKQEGLELNVPHHILVYADYVNFGTLKITKYSVILSAG
jgi:hypothetical protein